MPAIALATCSRLPALDADDAPLVAALRARGLEAVPSVWDDAAVEWARFDAIVVRSTWDYHQRRGEFLAWAERAGRATRLLNPYSVLRWNTHKFYLRALAEHGLPIVPTEFIPAGANPEELGERLEARRWTAFVIKPAVSASAWETLRGSAAELAPAKEHLARLLKVGDALLQPFVRSVDGYGERSLVFIGGRLSHAVRKTNAFSAQQLASHPVERVEVAPEELAVAEEVLATVGTEGERGLLYARVDLVRDEEGEPRLMELELTEPSLFFGVCAEGAEAMAEEIAGRVSGRG